MLPAGHGPHSTSWPWPRRPLAGHWARPVLLLLHDDPQVRQRGAVPCLGGCTQGGQAGQGRGGPEGARHHDLSGQALAIQGDAESLLLRLGGEGGVRGKVQLSGGGRRFGVLLSGCVWHKREMHHELKSALRRDGRYKGWHKREMHHELKSALRREGRYKGWHKREMHHELKSALRREGRYKGWHKREMHHEFMSSGGVRGGGGTKGRGVCGA